MESTNRDTSHLVKVACPWCGLDHTFYVQVKDESIPHVARCERVAGSGCGKLYAILITWQPQVDRWRLYEGPFAEGHDAKEKS